MSGTTTGPNSRYTYPKPSPSSANGSEVEFSLPSCTITRVYGSRHATETGTATSTELTTRKTTPPAAMARMRTGENEPEELAIGQKAIVAASIAMLSAPELIPIFAHLRPRTCSRSKPLNAPTNIGPRKSALPWNTTSEPIRIITWPLTEKRERTSTSKLAANAAVQPRTATSATSRHDIVEGSSVAAVAQRPIAIAAKLSAIRRSFEVWESSDRFIALGRGRRWQSPGMGVAYR